MTVLVKIAAVACGVFAAWRFVSPCAAAGFAALAVAARAAIALRRSLPAPRCPVLIGAPAMEVVRTRRSWRSYGREPTDSDLLHLRSYCARDDVATSPIAGSRVDVFVVRQGALASKQKLGTYGFISGAKCFLAGILRKDQSLEDFGVVFERAILEATRLGLCTCWLGGSFDGAGFTEAAAEAGFVLAPGDKVFCTSPIGYPADDVSFLRGLLMPNTNKDNENKTFRHRSEKLFFNADGTPIDTSKLSPAFVDALESVRLGPSASNRQPWRIVRASDKEWHFFGVPFISLYAAFAASDSGIAACHWEQVLAQHGVHGRWVVRSSAEAPSAPVSGALYRFTWVST